VNNKIITLYKLHEKIASRACRARYVECVESCCLTRSTQPNCMGSTCQKCRVVSRQMEFGLISSGE